MTNLFSFSERNWFRLFHPSRTSVYENQVLELFRDNFYERALGLVNRLIELHPDVAKYRLWQSWCYIHLRELMRASICLGQGLSLKTNQQLKSDAKLMMAEILWQHSDSTDLVYQYPFIKKLFIQSAEINQKTPLALINIVLLNLQVAESRYGLAEERRKGYEKEAAGWLNSILNQKWQRKTSQKYFEHLLQILENTTFLTEREMWSDLMMQIRSMNYEMRRKGKRKAQPLRKVNLMRQFRNAACAMMLLMAIPNPAADFTATATSQQLIISTNVREEIQLDEKNEEILLKENAEQIQYEQLAGGILLLDLEDMA